MITCREAVSQLWAYLDGAIAEADRVAVEEHLDVCLRCCGEAEFARELRSFLARHAAEELPADTRRRLASFLERL